MIRQTVLFANDDVLTQWVMSEVLTEAGFDVVSACRAEQVVTLLNDAPEFDILLADLTLSDGSGKLDVGCRWRQALPGRPVIYTGPDRVALRRPLRFGESFLVTPFSARALLQTIDRVLEDACFQPLSRAPLQERHHVH